MALVINATVSTPFGTLLENTAYVNIQEIYYKKDRGTVQISTATYTSEQARLNGLNPIKVSDYLYLFELSISLDELEASDLFEICYTKLKGALETIYGQGNIQDN